MDSVQVFLISVVTFLLFGMVIMFVMNRRPKKIDKNLEIIMGKGGADHRVDERDLQSKRRAEIAKKLKQNKPEKEINHKKASIAVRLEQAGLTIKPIHFWMMSLLSCFIFLFLAKFYSLSPIMTIFSGVIGLFGFPRLVLRRKINKRQRKFLQEFADALDAMVRLLKAGMPVTEAIKMISREFDGPVGEEMSRIYDKQKIGITLHEAALEATKRMPITEMQMFATGMAIQAQTGSSLSEVLTNLSGVIRARFRLKRKILALSSEAIASAGIIGSLPPVVALGLYFCSPGYLDPLFETDFGNTLLTGALVWMSMGVLVMRQMINFKI